MPFCYDCGNKYELESNYCNHCGIEIKSKVKNSKAQLYELLIILFKDYKIMAEEKEDKDRIRISEKMLWSLDYLFRAENSEDEMELKEILVEVSNK